MPSSYPIRISTDSLRSSADEANAADLPGTFVSLETHIDDRAEMSVSGGAGLRHRDSRNNLATPQAGRHSSSSKPGWTGPEALSKRLPDQQLPEDPFLELPNAASLAYGWHTVADGETDTGGEHTVEHQNPQRAQDGSIHPTAPTETGEKGFYEQIESHRHRWRLDWLRERGQGTPGKSPTPAQKDAPFLCVLTGAEVPNESRYSRTRTLFPPGFGTTLFTAKDSAEEPESDADAKRATGEAPQLPLPPPELSFPRAESSSLSGTSWNRHPVLGYVPANWSVDDVGRLKRLLIDHSAYEWRIEHSGEVVGRLTRKRAPVGPSAWPLAVSESKHGDQKQAPENKYDAASEKHLQRRTREARANNVEDEDTSRTEEERRRAQEEADFLREQQEQVICRICFEGAGSKNEKGKDMGRLISPCKCKGTMKFIHSSCLDSWRRFSSRSSSAIACDQCGAPYRFRKSRFVGMANSRPLLFLLSISLFLSLIWSVGWAAGTAIERWGVFDDDVRNAVLGAGEATGKRKEQTWGEWLLGTEDDDGHGYADQYNPHYSWSGGGWVIAGAGPFGYGGYSDAAGWYDLMKSAVRSVVSGESTQAIRQVVLGGKEQREHAVVAQDSGQQRGWWKALVHDWKYGPDGFWPGQAPAEDRAAAPAAGVNSDPQPAFEGASTRVESKENERYDVRTAAQYDPAVRAVRPTREAESAKERAARKRKQQKGEALKKKAEKRSATGRPAWVDKLLLRFSLGFSLIGMVSFINLTFGLSIFGPFHLNLGMGRGLARMTRSPRRNGGGGRGDAAAITSIILFALVVIGIARALLIVYKLVNALARRVLARAEDYVVDWGGHEEGEHPQQQQAPQGGIEVHG
ncbi:hypothetical protein K437DRAFT_276053 [Tilletiaria anomala UBC 951]|uniref:RING-CH-type domain-containing protein n=1 Tax=Tilletiaria anomala (strain ATCC 24038 / CBS 436.72 / UBC 951) TaxID=1037660 RepID=A0A066VGB4_TILAU|nr:uncharacterized protein K437DRAFT_276053 [Tilletiaria anomala UBC 951]KDN39323.1 hypothetical protein K437DRAFT_276053 [Tilletiaria anomala UBC 951]